MFYYTVWGLQEMHKLYCVHRSKYTVTCTPEHAIFHLVKDCPGAVELGMWRNACGWGVFAQPLLKRCWQGFGLHGFCLLVKSMVVHVATVKEKSLHYCRSEWEVRKKHCPEQALGHWWCKASYRSACRHSSNLKRFFAFSSFVAIFRFLVT